MRLYIRYYNVYALGSTPNTEVFDVDPECLVADLKQMIFARLRIEPKYLVLRVKNHGQFEMMNDELSIGFYNVKDGGYIYLENLQ